MSSTAIFRLTLLIMSSGLLYGGWAAFAEAPPLSKIQPSDPIPSGRFVEMAKLLNPAVVNIFTASLPRRTQIGRRPELRDPFFDLFERFMMPSPYQQRPVRSLGTGFIIREDGLIVTNNHVIDQADEIKVQLDDKSKEQFDATVVGKDARTDIALIKIKTKRKLPFARMGSSSDLQVGEWVAAFGNPAGLGHTMTKGIVSAIGREIDDIDNIFPFIQTDASINPGNSGGPLVNTQGYVIGVNTAIVAGTQGIGFAIPIDNVKSILPQLEKEGQIRRGFIGVYMTDIDKDMGANLNLKRTEGALITQVMPKSPADKAGLKPYDLVISFDGRNIESTKDLSRAVASAAVGRDYEIKVLRNGRTVTNKIRIGDQPGESNLQVRRSQTPERGTQDPHNFGFELSDYSDALAREFGLPANQVRAPIVVSVAPGSPAARAGLTPGDMILDVNRESVTSSSQAFKKLKKETNVLRVLKQDRIFLVYLKP